MEKIKRLFRLIFNFVFDKKMRFFYLAKAGFYDKMPDEKYLSRLFEYELGYRPDLADPKTFNEKLQWLKLHGFKEEYTDLADKIAVKPLVAEVLGDDKIIPTLKVWDRAEDIDIKGLPDRFVIKCNHTSTTGNIICKDKASLDRAFVKKTIEKALKTDYFPYRREYPYKNINRKAFAEEFIEGADGRDIDDYKVFVMNGRAEFIQVDYDRFTDHHRNFYDRNWNYVPFTTCYPTDSAHMVPKPDKLDELLQCAEKLRNNLAPDAPFLRTDFYIVGDRILFGEITFYHGAGLERFDPPEYDRKLGDMITLDLK